MRRLSWLAVLALAACGDSGPDQGAILVFDTPDGPMTATRIEVVLANAATATIADVDNQRREPGSNDDAAVRYYRQRAVGGTIEGMSNLAGFKLRIEPDMATSTDEQFIPFVFVYDADALVGVGVIEDANGDPAPAQITPGTVTSYTVTVTGVQVAGEDAAIDRGMARTVMCSGDGDAQAWKSGVAWFPVADPARPNGRAHQLRLLLPDLAADPAATDATGRTADLDCDQHTAERNDCDDLRTAFYNGAAESCDGLDTNCDEVRYVPQGCTAPNATCSVPNGGTTGVRICDDESGLLGACAANAACLCGTGGASQYCKRCIVDFTGSAPTKAACSPSVGKVTLGMCEGTTCTVEVAGATNGWRAYVSATETGAFTPVLTGAHNEIFLEAKLGDMIAPATGGIGEIYLRVTPALGTPVTVPIQMEMNAVANQCVPISNGMGTSKMICSP